MTEDIQPPQDDVIEYEEDTDTDEDEEQPKTTREISVVVPPNVEAPARYKREFRSEVHERMVADLTEVDV